MIGTILAWLTAYGGFVVYLICAALLVWAVFGLWRGPLREKFVPVLDETRSAIEKSLRKYVGGRGKMTEADIRIAQAAIVGGAILSGLTLLSAAVLLANIGTPVG